jgi:hypothetical protein
MLAEKILFGVLPQVSAAQQEEKRPRAEDTESNVAPLCG